MSQYQVDRMTELTRDRNRLRYELDVERQAAMIYAALAATGWAAFVLALFFA